MAKLQRYASKIPLEIRRPISFLGSKIYPIGARGQDFFSHLGTDILNDLPNFMPKFNPSVRNRLIDNKLDCGFVAERIRQLRIPHTPDAVQRITRFDFMNYMSEDILVQGGSGKYVKFA